MAEEQKVDQASAEQTPEDLEAMKKKFEEAGAKVELK